MRKTVYPLLFSWIPMLALAGFAALLTVTAPTAQAAPWPIKKFSVNERILVKRRELNLPDEITELTGESMIVPSAESWENLRNNYLTEEQEANIERWLERVAAYLESEGFRPPRYEATTFDGQAFEVYVNPFDGSASAQNDCGNPELTTAIHINPHSDTIFQNGELTIRGYQDLAHELFHTVQYAYPMFQGNCGQGGWIQEGTAEAVGIEIAKKLANKRADHFCQIGVRSYDKPLYVYKKDAPTDAACGQPRAYQSQSFWRFLGEYLEGGGRPKIFPPTPPDYSYLHHFFLTQHNSASHTDEYDWLNRALRKHFGFDVSRAYPSFIGTFAGYWERRLPLFPGNVPPDATQRRERWFKYLFGGCTKAMVAKTTTTLPLPLHALPALSARCVDLAFSFTGQANFTLVAEGSGRHLLDLAVTTEGGEKRLQPQVYPNEFQPEHVSFKFSVPVKAGERNAFVISNVANIPQDSVAQQPTLKLVMHTASSSLTDEKNDTPPDGPGMTDRQKAQKQIGQSYDTQSFRVSVSQQGPDNTTCDRHFVNTICGPYTQIDLDLVPDIVNIFDELANPGMLFERMMNVAGGVVERGEDNVPIDVAAAAKVMQSQDGHRIKIQVPRFGLGFSGSVDNALITVQKGWDGTGRAPVPYRSIGPDRVGGCDGPHGYYPFRGKITIDEASTTVLSGSYRAELVDRSSSIGGCVASLPVANIITGTFTAPNPLLDEAANSAQLSEDVLDSVIQSTNEMLPGLINEDMAAYIRERAAADANESQQAEAEQQSDAADQRAEQICVCSCDRAFLMASNQPDCFRQCEKSYQQCENHADIQEFYRLIRKPVAEEMGEVAELRQRYTMLVDSLNLNKQLQQSMLDTFEDLPGLAAKRQLVETLQKSRR